MPDTPHPHSSHTLFVYGTLLQGFGLHRRLEDARFLGPALIPGRLVDLGSFPGLVPAPVPSPGATDSPIVVGELYAVDDATLASLDLVEGFDPEAPATSLYRRERVTATRLGDGASTRAWAYFYNHSVDDLTPIPHGDYRRFHLEVATGPKLLLNYGSNMSSDRLHARIGATPRVLAGTLPGFRMVFNKRPSLGDGAYANLVHTGASHAAPFTTVPVTPNQLDVLDHFEGTDDHYLRTTLMVALDALSTPRPCFVYLAHPAMIIPETAPTEPYVSHVRAGYREHGFVPNF